MAVRQIRVIGDEVLNKKCKIFQNTSKPLNVPQSTL